MPKLMETAAKLNDAIIATLKGSNEPLCALDAYGKPEIARYAANADKVSNVMSYLYKKGALKRVPFTHASSKQVKFAYAYTDSPATRTRRTKSSIIEMTLRVKLNGADHNLSLEEARRLRDSLNSFFLELK